MRDDRELLRLHVTALFAHDGDEASLAVARKLGLVQFATTFHVT